MEFENEPRTSCSQSKHYHSTTAGSTGAQILCFECNIVNMFDLNAYWKSFHIL